MIHIKHFTATKVGGACSHLGSIGQKVGGALAPLALYGSRAPGYNGCAMSIVFSCLQQVA